jgi:hypothetical protein
VAELEDLRDFLDAPKLTLPIGGRRYVVEPATAEVWLRLQAVAADAEAAAKGDGEALARSGRVSDLDVYRLALGPAFDEMLPKVSKTELGQAGMTAWFWQLGQQELAETYWRSGGKASPPPRKTTTSTGGRVARSRTASPSTTRPRRKSSAA